MLIHLTPILATVEFSRSVVDTALAVSVPPSIAAVVIAAIRIFRG